MDLRRGKVGGVPRALSRADSPDRAFQTARAFCGLRPKKASEIVVLKGYSDVGDDCVAHAGTTERRLRPSVPDPRDRLLRVTNRGAWKNQTRRRCHVGGLRPARHGHRAKAPSKLTGG
jgi:hypothetical protein